MKQIVSAFLLAVTLLVSCAAPTRVHTALPDNLNGFTQWRTGHDPETVQQIPSSGNNPLMMDGQQPVVHVRFVVGQYGEVSFPINRLTPPDTEALRVDLSHSRFIRLTYKSNHPFILQLRQTGVHGGTHPHVTLPASAGFTTVTLPYDLFTGGITTLDLKDVAKFNFAFLGNNPADGYADLVLRDISIDAYQP